MASRKLVVKGSLRVAVPQPKLVTIRGQRVLQPVPQWEWSRYMQAVKG